MSPRPLAFGLPRARLCAWALAPALLLVSAPGHAADPAAESLFQDALGLMRDGQFAEACPKLAASQKQEPKSGTLIMLASCHEQQGKTASAWAEYKEAASLARTEGRQDYVDKATGLAAGIEPKLSRLRVVAEPARGGEAAAITLDGAALPEGMLNAAVAIDPGEHQLGASAPGKIGWASTVKIGPEADLQQVLVPRLQDDPAAAARQAPPRAGASGAAPLAGAGRRPDAPPRAPDLPEATSGGVPAWAWVVGGVGLALGGAAIGFAVDQSSAASTLDDRCGEARNACPGDYDFEPDRARELRDFGLFVGLGAAGLVGIGAAVVGIATAPAASGSGGARHVPRVAPWAGPTLGGITIVGGF